MSKRNEIANMLQVVARNAVADYRCLGYDYKDKDDYEDFLDEADGIIAMIREAMLSEKAMMVARDIEMDLEGVWGFCIKTTPAMLDAVGFGESHDD